MYGKGKVDYYLPFRGPLGGQGGYWGAFIGISLPMDRILISRQFYG